jgi:hypothetical protein
MDDSVVRECALALLAVGVALFLGPGVQPTEGDGGVGLAVTPALLHSGRGPVVQVYLDAASPVTLATHRVSGPCSNGCGGLIGRTTGASGERQAAR